MPPVQSSMSIKEPRLGKKMGIMQKPKGAVRAKSGCYTCRIRRKKCDEKRVGGYEDGPCETCSRLKLECLGFGAKRPEWLRENSRVSSIRDRIKAHLAAQGMIKGHAGSGARSTVQEEFLRLSDPRDDDMTYRTGGSSSSTDSPRGSQRGGSVEDDDPYSVQPRFAPSQMRSMYDPRFRYDYPVHSDIHSRSHSPAVGSAYYDLEPAKFPLVPYRHDYEILNPATRSSFSSLYHTEQFEGLFIMDELPEVYDPQYSVHHVHPSVQIPAEYVDTSMRSYIDNVVRIQYLLGDRRFLPHMIWDSVREHQDSHEAVKLLARAYYGRQSDANYSVLKSNEFQTTIKQLKGSLVDKETMHNTANYQFNADDAMTALHVVSLYLFDGGQGKWNEFLTFASKYVTSVLGNGRFYNARDALENASPKDRFVVKTTIWFDVIASITMRKPPVLLDYIRYLFNPNMGRVEDPNDTRCSMMTPMGCDNTVVWALAETSYLSWWKKDRERQGNLSVRELVRQVQNIEGHLQPTPRPHRPQGDADGAARFIASEIFRTATKLFLKSVESGDHPHVEEVQECVTETFNAIMEFPAPLLYAPAAAAAVAGVPNEGYIHAETKSAVVRSTVFGIFICGSLTDDSERRRVLMNHLLQNSGHERVGNCLAVSTLLDRMWMERDRERERGAQSLPVRWRQALHRAQILLV